MAKNQHDEQLMIDFDSVKDRHFAFTGKLRRFTRKEAFQMIQLLGGEGDQTVKKNTQYLVIGKQVQKSKDGKTIKYRRAEDLKEQGQDIKLLPEQDFYDLLRESI